MVERGRDDPRGLTAEQVIENIASFPLVKDLEYDERGAIKSGSSSYSEKYSAWRNQRFAKQWLEHRAQSEDASRKRGE